MTRAQLLMEYLDKQRTRRFRPGSHDCGLFVAGWVKRATGVDHGARYRGKYRSMGRLADILAEDGFASHVDYIASLFSETHPSRAQTGDLAVCARDAMGIFASDRVFVLRPDGLGHVCRMQARKAFAI